MVDVGRERRSVRCFARLLASGEEIRFFHVRQQLWISNPCARCHPDRASQGTAGAGVQHAVRRPARGKNCA
eukprot:2380548-Alexandrium_andersonii.AAC.1